MKSSISLREKVLQPLALIAGHPLRVVQCNGAAGRAGVPFDQVKTALWAGILEPQELQLLAGGTPTAYLESDAAAVFAEPEFKILFELQQGNGKATVWTSDLTHEYVSINADYRT